MTSPRRKNLSRCRQLGHPPSQEARWTFDSPERQNSQLPATRGGASVSAVSSRLRRFIVPFLSCSPPKDPKANPSLLRPNQFGGGGRGKRIVIVSYETLVMHMASRKISVHDSKPPPAIASNQISEGLEYKISRSGCAQHAVCRLTPREREVVFFSLSSTIFSVQFRTWFGCCCWTLCVHACPPVRSVVPLMMVPIF